MPADGPPPQCLLQLFKQSQDVCERIIVNILPQDAYNSLKDLCHSEDAAVYKFVVVQINKQWQRVISKLRNATCLATLKLIIDL